MRGPDEYVLRRVLRYFLWTAFLLHPVAWSPGNENVSVEPQYLAKAKYIYVMSKYVSWPNGAFRTTDAPIVIGVLGDDPFHQNLETVLGRRRSQNRPFVIRRSDNVKELSKCHVLFIAQSEAGRREEILTELQGKPVLTVCEMKNFFYAGAVIYLFINEETRSIQFKVNRTAAVKAKLKINPRMLDEASEIWVDQTKE